MGDIFSHLCSFSSGYFGTARHGAFNFRYKWPQKKRVEFLGEIFSDPKITGVFVTSPYTPWKCNSEFTPENKPPQKERRILFQAIHFCRGKTVKLAVKLRGVYLYKNLVTFLLGCVRKIGSMVSK